MTTNSVTAEVELRGFEIDAAGVGMANASRTRATCTSQLDGGEFDTPLLLGRELRASPCSSGILGRVSPCPPGPPIASSSLPWGGPALEVGFANSGRSQVAGRHRHGPRWTGRVSRR